MCADPESVSIDYETRTSDEDLERAIFLQYVFPRIGYNANTVLFQSLNDHDWIDNSVTDGVVCWRVADGCDDGCDDGGGDRVTIHAPHTNCLGYEYTYDEYTYGPHHFDPHL